MVSKTQRQRDRETLATYLSERVDWECLRRQRALLMDAVGTGALVLSDERSRGDVRGILALLDWLADTAADALGETVVHGDELPEDEGIYMRRNDDYSF
jgi:hypothetical protein